MSNTLLDEAFDGGSFYCDYSNVTITNSTFENNTKNAIYHIFARTPRPLRSGMNCTVREGYTTLLWVLVSFFIFFMLVLNVKWYFFLSWYTFFSRMNYFFFYIFLILDYHLFFYVFVGITSNKKRQLLVSPLLRTVRVPFRTYGSSILIRTKIKL